MRIIFPFEQSEERLIIHESTEKGSEKSSEKVIKLIKENPKISAQALGLIIGISARAVEKHLASLKKSGVLKHIGSDKSGYWEIVDK
ncbi:MAG: winged helix-turn-helix transcriptional regulator [Bacteroidota bacterium]